MDEDQSCFDHPPVADNDALLLRLTYLRSSVGDGEESLLGGGNLGLVTSLLSSWIENLGKLLYF